MVPLMDSAIHELELVHQRVHCEEVGVVEYHHCPGEQETPQQIEREGASVEVPMSAFSPQSVGHPHVDHATNSCRKKNTRTPEARS